MLTQLYLDKVPVCLLMLAPSQLRALFFSTRQRQVDVVVLLFWEAPAAADWTITPTCPVK